MTAAERIDQLVDVLNRHRMGADYEPESSPPWAHLVEEWEIFKILVDTLDYAVRDPFASRSASILVSVAKALQASDAIELCAALRDVGHALGFAAAFPEQSGTEGAR
jgi:hypothetical protein